MVITDLKNQLTDERAKVLIKEQPEEITVCYLECVLMPNGELISLGKTVGWFRDYKDYLTRERD